MNFAWSEEQEEFRASIRRFVAERWPIGEARRLAGTATGYDPGVWKQLAGELGLVGVAVPEEHGGQGFSMLELGIALDELGRELAGGPFFATACLAVLALRNAATAAQQAELLPGIAAGETIVTLAVADAPAPAHPDTISCQAQREGGGSRVTGRKRFVIDGQNASLLLVAAREAGSRGAEGVGLFAVEVASEGVRIEPAPGLDLTRKLAHLELEGAPAERLGEAGSAWPALERTLAEAAIGLASEQIGGASRCLELVVAHARDRIQFGRPIGSFQAVKHRAVDVLTLLELARSTAWWSAWVAASGGQELSEASAVARSMACEAFDKAAYECIHLHGGMGFTWEHDAHLYFRRARAGRVLFGDPAAQRAGLARALGLLA